MTKAELECASARRPAGAQERGRQRVVSFINATNVKYNEITSRQKGKPAPTNHPGHPRDDERAKKSSK